MELQQRLAFCSSGQAQELWPSLMEKAYAQLHGGYPAIASGSIADALVDLTGGVLVSKVNLSREDQMVDAAEGALWSRIVAWLSTDSLIACMCKQCSDSSNQSATRPAYGVAANTPYSILSAKVLSSGSRLLQLHCPWSPEGMWQGPWAAGSAEWDSQEAQAAIADDAVVAEGLQDPTTFWCSYWDFIQVFNRCWVVQVLPEFWQQLRVVAGWAGATAGGPPTAMAAQPLLHAGDATDSPTGCSPGFPCTANSSGQPAAAAGAVPALPVGAVGLADGPCKTAMDAVGRANTSQKVRHSAHLQPLQSQQQQQQRLRQQQQQQQQQQKQCLSGGRQLLVRSSWCCNPQFRLTVSGDGEVGVCLGQRDIQLVNNKYEPRRQRDFQIGLTVLKHSSGSLAPFGSHKPKSPTRSTRCRSAMPFSGSNHQGRQYRSTTAAGTQSQRVWDPHQCTVVKDTGLSSRREVVVRFRGQQGQTYMLVPYTRKAGDTGPFTIRSYAVHTMQLEQLPSPLSLVIGGQWSGHMAGGRSCHCQTWGSNPQYIISCQRATTAVIAVVRPDISMLPGTATLPFEPTQCIGITVCSPGVTTGGLGRRAAILDSATEVYAESDYSSMDEAVLLVQLQPEVPYLLVPCTAQPGVEAPFELRLLSSHPLELIPLPEVHSISHKGTWEPGSAGGCNIHASWMDNPAFALKLDRRCLCRISIKRTGGSWSHNKSLGEMLGFYILKHPAASGKRCKTTAAIKQLQLYESVFVPAESCEAEVQLPGGQQLLLVPCTYAPGRYETFAVTVTAATTAGLTLEAMPAGFAAATVA